MPHQCVRCAVLYPTGCQELLTGCKCGSRFFFFVKESSIERAKEITLNLTSKEKDQIEKDVIGIVGSEVEGNPIILDFESIKVVKPGKYELDLIDLFKGKPLIYKLDEGKYVIDIVSTFESQKKKSSS
jgi:predicted  nucleic acid-binding Zn-ribbon protein